MKNHTIFLDLEQIVSIHDFMVDAYGGSHGIRSIPLLESALFRPQTTFGGKFLYKSIFDKAAALMHSLIFNHAFVDGNKRTATASTLTFLELNGFSFVLDQSQLTHDVVNMENKKWGVNKIVTWLKKHSKKIKRG